LHCRSRFDLLAFMRRPYLREVRAPAVAAYEAGEGSYARVALLFNVGEATLKRWVRAHRTTGQLTPAPKGGGTPSTITEAELVEVLTRLKDGTAFEITAELNRGRVSKARVHVSSVKRALQRYGYVVKKSADARWRY
jgi:transposase